MFGKRGNEGFGKSGTPGPAVPPPVAVGQPAATERPAVPVLGEPTPAIPKIQPAAASPARRRTARTEDYYDTKSQVFSAQIGRAHV